jgi:hypothetical protein
MFLTMNLFRKESSISQAPNAEQIALTSTRIYMILLTLALMILALSNGLGRTIISATVDSPSMAMFERLRAEYPTKLSCPCERLAVPHSTFMSVSVSYHQVSKDDILW